MDKKYLNWIKENVKDSGYGKCKEITSKLLLVFPELKQVRGHYYCPIWGERGHWWLVAPDKIIVDPTAEQFPSRGHGIYKEWIEGSPEPTGQCPNCSAYCYNGDYFCSEKCGVEYTKYCNDTR